ncbi:MAG TPA: alpha/beta-hydrolase family protein [Solirubrobacteraceae bacterium]|nr:alpha/beta-hydrolase family protein [Solirubrobacteraceae bacterium]
MVRRDTARYMAALALALSFAPSLMRRQRREQIAVSAGAAGLGAAAGWAAETVVAQLARRVEGGETAARLTLAGAGAAAALLRLERRSGPLALAGTGLRVAGIAAMVGWAAPERRRVRGFDPLPLAAAGALAAAVLAARAERRRRGRKPLDYPCDAYLPTVSHGPASLVSGLDFEGQRFCAGAVAGLAQDPVRVFVGVRSAPDVGARCDLAVAELERLGGFGRARLVVCSATLRGYVNPVPVAAEERFSEGDVAHVVVQYYDRRTPWLWRKVPVAAQTHRELLGRLGPRVAAGGPELCVSGESLGAWASQQVFRDEGVPGLERRGVRRALWVGTPYFSRFARRLREGSHPAVEWIRTREIREADPPHAEQLRYVFLERLTDPVVLFPGFELLWRRPPWHPGGSWRPGISFLHGLLDLVKATRWTADEPASAGHDYRIELPLAVNVAFGHRREREEAVAVGERVLADEAARAAAVRAARRAAGAASAPRGRRGSRARRRPR